MVDIREVQTAHVVNIQDHRRPQTVHYLVITPDTLLRGMVFNAPFNNISVISWRSVVLVEEIAGVPGENHRNTLSHTVVSSTPRHHWASAGWELLTISA